MEITTAIQILKTHNEWRKGSDEVEMGNPKELSEAIDVIVKFCEIRIELEADFIKALSEVQEGR
jgi:hypothetical protein